MALNPWEFADKTKTEFAEQTALFMWSAMAHKFGLRAADDPKCYSVAGHALATYGPMYGPNSIPQLFWLHAIKNQGHGDAIRGAKSAQEGVKPGVPDTFLPVPHRGFGEWRHGLYVELKRRASVGKSAGRASDEQERWANYLRSVGYEVEVCVGWEAARDCIVRYLGLGSPVVHQ